jgi:2,3-bisphosphoglycerate-independent phosphoglycerate mutase
MASKGQVTHVENIPDNEPSPEAAYLGLDPALTRIASGPLVVAALGAEPPPKSVHFHLSLISFEDDHVAPIPLIVPAADLEIIKNAVGKLDTRTLTIVWGDNLDHGLVWEDGSIDLGTSPPTGQLSPYRAHLPEGDGEPLLRRFIDDSINLLGELELNQRRIDEGLPPVNCLWPWGQGFRPALADLGLRRGRSAIVESSSLRLQGLCKLVGYRHNPRSSFGAGTSVRLERLLTSSADIIVLDQIREFRSKDQLEEAKWLTAEIDRRLFEPWAVATEDEPIEILVLTTGAPVGLALHYRSNRDLANSIPFDERATQDSLTRSPLWELADRFLSTASL